MSDTDKHTNDLIHEQSPYLLQHAHNPVNWKPWNEETLKLARQEKKMLIISIGYAACHWCHVMEHESFEDHDVARLMNEHFISIKVDREERPDVDQVYMDAAQLISGRGGWPLNAFALPDGRPFYAGTYFPKDQWMAVLRYLIGLYRNEPGKLIEQAGNLTDGIRSVDHITPSALEPEFRVEQLENTYQQLAPQLDPERGGINRAPKFPMPSVWEFLLHYHHLTGDAEAVEQVHTTLQQMAFGGIYDQLGGGFARYSTDADWHVPHFEKMLYDNAQLVSLYAHAYQQHQDPLYKQVVYETLEFIRGEMTSPEGGFYSSLDADSEGEEGKFYVWTRQEINDLLGSEAPVFNAYYDVTASGNWESGRNVLRRTATDREMARKTGQKVNELRELISRGKEKLLKARAGRIRPALDDKILTSWNALMLRGHVHAFRAFNDAAFLEAALKNARFLLKNAVGNNLLMTRSYKEGLSTIPGFLDDYAFTISALIELYQATFNEQWLDTARNLSNYVIDHFHDPSTGMFYYSHQDHAGLIARKLEISDNVIPASNSEMARNLYALGHYDDNESWLAMAGEMLAKVREDVQRNLFYFSNWGILQAWMVHPPAEVAILGEDHVRLRTELDQYHLPFMLLSGGTSEGSLKLLNGKLVPGKTTIYVCRNKVCKLPVQEVSEALELFE